ncbi:hypothetical protein PQO03_03925 [Lentisphaera profundi]|uniref:Prepilin-type N-terminal cleavage/methylation domain-containing protein n=1 Tax=Lentisphaera profundi TaxID=1658616 RepID=A0ABY7VWJ8_9BACT|nr:hypothetical protein [Lentisphaera profundi]WDE97104.1 hypothetical protein PQO03_03925 [Lentisphaera profundi]
MKNKNKIKSNFTLIEIAVVLVVLVALAGLVVPKALGYAQRSHGATGAGNMAQLEAQINRFEIEKFSMPDNWDNLIDPTSSGADAYSTAFGVATLPTDQADALNSAGITIVHELFDKDGVEAGAQLSTFQASDVDSDSAVDSSLVVATVPAADVRVALGNANSATDTYVAFGIGEALTAVGVTMTAVPYDFPEGAERPEDSYRRFIAIFNVSGEKAKLAGVVANEDGVLLNIQDHIAEYYEATE